MSIGTTLFHTQTMRSLTALNEKIAALQGDISSGVQNPRASDDPVRALRLSAAQEQAQALDRFGANLERAQSRLDQADTVLNEAVSVMRRIGELALRAVSDTATASERESIRTETNVLRDSLMNLANARDDTGLALFGGYRTAGDPFADQVGGVAYLGDNGEPQLQVSETMNLPTGLNGSQVFGAFPGSDGADVFTTIDDFLTALTATDMTGAETVTGAGALGVSLVLGRDVSDWSLSLDGPNGRADITFRTAAGGQGAATAAINAQSAVTGISAIVDPETGELQLLADGAMTLSNLAVDPAPGRVLAQASDETGATYPVVAAGQGRNALLDRLQLTTDHLIDQRTRLGAMSASATRQTEVIANRALSVEQAVSGLQDLDLADALTRLQQAMLTRDATQQAYVKITQKSLFDYLR